MNWVKSSHRCRDWPPAVTMSPLPSDQHPVSVTSESDVTLPGGWPVATKTARERRQVPTQEWCTMTTCWSQEEHDASIQVEQEAGRNVRIPPEPLAPVPDAHIDPSLANRVERQALLTAGHTRWRASFIGWGVMVVALVLGTVILYFLDAVRLGVLVSAMMVAGVLAAVGFGHYLLRGRAGIGTRTAVTSR